MGRKRRRGKYQLVIAFFLPTFFLLFSWLTFRDEDEKKIWSENKKKQNISQVFVVPFFLLYFLRFLVWRGFSLFLAYNYFFHFFWHLFSPLRHIDNWLIQVLLPRVSQLYRCLLTLLFFFSPFPSTNQMCCLLRSTPIHTRILRARSGDGTATSILLELIRQVNERVNTTKLVITSCGKKEANWKLKQLFSRRRKLFFIYKYIQYLFTLLKLIV